MWKKRETDLMKFESLLFAKVRHKRKKNEKLKLKECEIDSVWLCVYVCNMLKESHVYAWAVIYTPQKNFYPQLLFSCPTSPAKTYENLFHLFFLVKGITELSHRPNPYNHQPFLSHTNCLTIFLRGEILL